MNVEELIQRQAVLKARRVELNERFQALGKCVDREAWFRREELLADIANNKARLRAVNIAIAEAGKLAAASKPREPKVKKPPRPGPRQLSTGQVLRRAVRRMLKTIERLENPEPFTLEFARHLRTYIVEQEEHVAWRLRSAHQSSS